MMKALITAVAISGAFGAAVLPAAQAQPPALAPVVAEQAAELTAAQQKSAVLRLLAAYSSNDPAAFNTINPRRFVQHHPEIADGVTGLKAWLAAIPAGKISVTPVRVLSDGPYVMVHSLTKLPDGDHAAWDVFRFENRQIVEQWHAQQRDTPPNGAGHTQFDGATAIEDRHLTQQNKARAWTVLTKVFRDGDFALLDEPLWNARDYVQHSHLVNEDGAAASREAFRQAFESGAMEYTKVVKILGEGNFVLSIGELKLNGQPASAFNLIRFKEGKVIEHWEILPLAAPAAGAKNGNGLYNFPQDSLVPGTF